MIWRNENRQVNMTSFQVLLPVSMRAVIDARVKAGGFNDAADYLCYLVCEDKVSDSIKSFEDEVMEQLAAGATPSSEADVERIKHEIEERRSQELRDEVLRGAEQADRREVEPLDMNAIISEGRKRLAAAQVSHKAVG